MIHAGVSSFFGLGLEGGHVPTFWLLLWGLLKRGLAKGCKVSVGLIWCRLKVDRATALTAHVY